MEYSEYIGQSIKIICQGKLDVKGVVKAINSSAIVLSNPSKNNQKSDLDELGIDVNLIDTIDFINYGQKNHSSLNRSNSNTFNAPSGNTPFSVYNCEENPPNMHKSGFNSAVCRNLRTSSNQPLYKQRTRTSHSSSFNGLRKNSFGGGASTNVPSWLNYSGAEAEEFDFESNLAMWDKETFCKNKRMSRSKNDVVAMADASVKQHRQRKQSNPAWLDDEPRYDADFDFESNLALWDKKAFCKSTKLKTEVMTTSDSSESAGICYEVPPRRSHHSASHTNNQLQSPSRTSLNHLLDSLNTQQSSSFSLHQSDFSSQEDIDNPSLLPSVPNFSDIRKSFSFSSAPSEPMASFSSSAANNAAPNKADIFNEFQELGIIPASHKQPQFSNKSCIIVNNHCSQVSSTVDPPHLKRPVHLFDMMTPHNWCRSETADEARSKFIKSKTLHDGTKWRQQPDLIKDATISRIRKEFNSILNINEVKNDLFNEEFTDFWKIDDDRKVPVLSTIQRQHLFNTCNYSGLHTYRDISSTVGKSIANFVYHQILKKCGAPKIAILIGEQRCSIYATHAAQYLVEEYNCQVVLYCDESGFYNNHYDSANDVEASELTLNDAIYRLKQTCQRKWPNTSCISDCFTYRYEDLSNHDFDYILSGLEDGSIHSDQRRFVPASPEPGLCDWLRSKSAVTPIAAIDPPETAQLFYQHAIFVAFPITKPNKLEVRVKQLHNASGFFMPRMDGVKGLQIDTFFAKPDGQFILCDAAIPNSIYKRVGLEFSSPYASPFCGGWIALFDGDLKMVE